MAMGSVVRLYLMEVGAMPDYDVPITCYLVQTDTGRNVLVDTGLPATIVEADAAFVNGRDVVDQLADLGLTPADVDVVVSTHYDADHAGRHASFPRARYVVQRRHHLDAADNPRYATVRAEWDQPSDRIQLVDGDTELLPGLELIETSGHVPGHQSVLVRLPTTGPVLLAVDAVPFRDGFTRDAPSDAATGPDAEATRTSILKLLDLVEREQVALVVFGHDAEQWRTLRTAPAYYD